MAVAKEIVAVTGGAIVTSIENGNCNFSSNGKVTNGEGIVEQFMSGGGTMN